MVYCAKSNSGGLQGLPLFVLTDVSFVFWTCPLIPKYRAHYGMDIPNTNFRSCKYYSNKTGVGQYL